MSAESPAPDLVERLRQHRALAKVPDTELQWLAEHGRLQRFQAGEFVARKGQEAAMIDFGLAVILEGRFGVYLDRGGSSRRVIGWHAGELSGVLPFSRMKSTPGDLITESPMEILSINPHLFPGLIRECPTITGVCVHVMLDRARIFKTTDLQDEKMVSLGKLSAGLAHELNNPASAVARSAGLLQRSMAEADRAARQLAQMELDKEQLAAVDRVREACMREPPTVSLSPLERLDREDEIAAWLVAHGADRSAVDALSDTAVTFEALNDLAEYLEGQALDAALDWVAAGCAVRTLASETERAGSRISALVSAMKRLTHMDRAPVAEATDIEQGLRDTLTVLGHKARHKSVSVQIDVPSDLPAANAIGGELDQVWMNILDNALDAVESGGQVSVTAAPEGHMLVVRIVDDGPGIPPEHQGSIFDPFFTTKPPGEGTGLGLDIARTHLRAQGGDIDFESRPGRTEFRVFLPLAEPDA